MPLRTNLRAGLPMLLALAVPTASLLGQGAFAPQGGEYRIAGELPGDQVAADQALGPDGGYLVWQDNHTDGDGAGISAVKISSAGTATFEPFRVNIIGAGDQLQPRIARFSNGSHLIVWQGGTGSGEAIYGRALNADGLFVGTTDTKINTHTGTSKITPAIAALENARGVVTWGSFGQDDANNPLGSRRGLQGVYAQIVTSDLTKVGPEFQVNQTTEFNQRTPAVAKTADGKFVIVWVTEHLTGSGQSENVDAVNIMARLFDGNNGQAVTGEFKVNTSTNICANPSVVGTSDGGFTIVWSEKNLGDADNSWDVAGRHFVSSAASAPAQFTINTFRYGDQYRPIIKGEGDQQLVVWSSMGQDGQLEGVFGRVLSFGQASGGEYQVNTTTVSRQVLPTIAQQSDSSFLVTWSSFAGGVGSVDLFAQRFATTVPKPGAPLITALSSYQLLIAWPAVGGFDISAYLLYVDGHQSPIETANSFFRLEALYPATEHTVRIAYKLSDGRISPLSDTAVGRTWGPDNNFDGLPDDWEQQYFGTDSSKWPSASSDSDGDGVNNLTEFLAGTDPSDSQSVLKVEIVQTSQGWKLDWNSMPGLIYKLQSSTDFKAWSDIGGYRFSAGNSNSAFIEPAGGMAYYRIVRIR